MQVYKFLSWKYGKKAICESRIKISMIKELNDPFELLPFDLSDCETREAVLASRDEFKRDKGLLCFSQRWHNPLLWAHYADGHCGICLGFEIPQDRQLAVEYIDKQIRLRQMRLDEELARKWISTKFLHWQYEEEVRVTARLEDKCGDHYFRDFGPDLRLNEVLLGARCDVTKRKLAEALGSRSGEIAVRKVRASYSEFKMIEDESWAAG